MKKILIASLALAAFACDNTAVDATESGQAELVAPGTLPVTRVPTPSSSATCGGWTCAQGSMPVSPDQIWQIVGRYDHTGDGPLPPTVRLDAIQCAALNDSCGDVAACSVRTTCGGGGAVTPEESRVLWTWLKDQSTYTESADWAQRKSVFKITCTKQSGAARCSSVPFPTVPPTE